jgi:hypothetical protein
MQKCFPNFEPIFYYQPPTVNYTIIFSAGIAENIILLEH